MRIGASIPAYGLYPLMSRASAGDYPVTAVTAVTSSQRASIEDPTLPFQAAAYGRSGKVNGEAKTADEGAASEQQRMGGISVYA